MGVSLLAGVAIYSVMGLIVAKERIPAFIITLGGLLIFKGLFWKVIGNQTVPVKVGDTENTLSVLTTWYLPLWASIALVSLTVAVLAIAQIRSRAKRRSYGFEVESGELAFSKLFIKTQVLILALVVLSQFRGVPLSLVVLAAVALVIWVISLILL